MISLKRKRDEDGNLISNNFISLFVERDSSDLLNTLINNLIEKYGLTSQEVIDLIERDVSFPVSLFYNGELSALELIVRYLKEHLGMKYSEIARLLNRNDRTIWNSYKNSRKKRNHDLIIEKSLKIPVRVLADRKYSVLESIVRFLKDKHNLSYHEIAVLLNRNDRTIWTVYDRSLKKRG